MTKVVLDNANLEHLTAHTSLLIDELGVQLAASIANKSPATIRRYCQFTIGGRNRFIGIDVVAKCEQVASYGFVSEALADLSNPAVEKNELGDRDGDTVKSAMVSLSDFIGQIFATYSHAKHVSELSVDQIEQLVADQKRAIEVLRTLRQSLITQIKQGPT